MEGGHDDHWLMVGVKARIRGWEEWVTVVECEIGGGLLTDLIREVEGGVG